jgi:hypothetical protein
VMPHLLMISSTSRAAVIVPISRDIVNNQGRGYRQVYSPPWKLDADETLRWHIFFGECVFEPECVWSQRASKGPERYDQKGPSGPKQLKLASL